MRICVDLLDHCFECHSIKPYYKMSGHNPHSRVSQPVNSSSWNHLQVPPYARQPQLAHMSSERTLRSSPLIWPNTNPADAFYNYMALTAAAAVANSNPKNTALDINPLLPFVRTPANAMPFNSVDLSLSSTASVNRNSLSPSPRNQISPGSSSSSNRFPKILSDVEESVNHGANNKMDSNKMNTDPIAFLNEMSEQFASMRSNRNLAATSALARDSNNLNSDLSSFRTNGGNEKSKQRNEPMELVKEPNTANLFENESLSQSVHLQQLLGLAPPVTSSITPNLNDLSKSLLSIFNNTSSPAPLLISPKSASNFGARQSDTPKNCLNTSNDDSLDSQSASCNGDELATGKSQNTRYRRRKQQKTVRLSNELNTMDSGSAPLDHEKDHVTKNEHKTDPINSNGINFSSFHSDANSILPQPNAGILPPQTQSMDLSHHCAGQEIFENGLVNYSKPNNLDLTNASGGGGSGGGGERTDKPPNLLQTDEMNNLNLFGAVNFSHLRGTNLTNDIATFPNTDDLVKKVEELVKCNEQNGFGSNEFEPMELTKSNANKLVSDAYENNRLSNGISDVIKIANNVDHMTNHSATIKCNGNGILPEIISNPIDSNENKTQEIDHGIASDVKISNGTPPPIPNASENGEFNVNNTEIDSDKIISNHNDDVQSANKHDDTAFDGISSIDVYGTVNGKPSTELTDQSSFNSNFASAQHNFTANTQNENHTSSYNSNDLTKEATSASSSDSRSNPSPTPKKKATSKKKATNRYNGKMTKQNSVKINQKNAKSKDKSEKKSDIKKTKSKDESTSDVLNKFRGPYVHVERDGTLEVINAPLNEEIAEKQSKFKKNYISQRPADRNRIRGLHVSTLSNKYDAVTTDISWMCVFCKLGPHKYGLGDLFGPFILSTESEDFQLAQIDPKADIFKSIRNRAHMTYTQNMSATAAKSISRSGSTGNVVVKKKRKLNQSDNDTTSNVSASIESVVQNNDVDIFCGMTRASDCSYEVWAHEDCIVWASGVHIIGARVVGLETAVWSSVRHQCQVCKQYGAMLSCLQRSCTNEVHVPCAKRSSWILNEQSFQSRCSEHSLNSRLQHDESNSH